ncbi:SOS response-associated peptidase family protein [Glaciecola petra]|uniref:SOS response-associated peptidase family protein n=1 Tax=Glaciecola petra TaxID=3075602 RepID=A0ABU2ZLH8_9ALTE|nr:SOS response-associated peptidase family protein [Aestuariibacter sp. P117]MDT0593256.1 SOS response-associated peptidase family protein [Aestuariibacter sp. P117]
MCGFVSYEQATIKEHPQWEAAMTSVAQLPLEFLLSHWRSYSAYPAFGGDTNKRIPLMIRENGELKRVEAVWWFDANCQEYQQSEKGDSTSNITVLGRRTSFNARNLDSPFWKGALNKHRGVVFANHLGESKLVGKTKHQYLMRSQEPFLLGAVYRKLPNGDYCCAIITRDAHPKMTPYHEKAFPLFLPVDNDFIGLWLSTQNAQHAQIQYLLNAPKLYPSLHVQRVKTYKDKQLVGNINDILLSDEA